MVVASSGRVQNADFSPKQDENNMSTTIAKNNKMSAKAILICRENSHTFQRRTLNLDEPVKIGRSVARTRASVDNAIFDCKVLSRNHALLWYNGGKFYLQDTGSSNGTFVNNQRLSNASSESNAKEVCSGDIVQFGVDVIESTKNVTHGCIIATLKLFLPIGKEAKSNRTLCVTRPDVTLEDLYKLNQYVQEANRREEVLQSKLTYLQKMVNNMRKSANSSWKALIDEDRLLSRVKTVENQLVAYSKNFSDDKVRNELVKLEEEKAQYQIAAKEVLQKVHLEKVGVSQKLMQLESRLNETEEECQSLHEISKHAHSELLVLATRYSTAQKNLAQLEEKLVEKEQSLIETVEKASQDKEELIGNIETQSKLGLNLQNKLKINRLVCINIHKKITSLRNYLETLQDMNSKLITEESKESVNPIEVINAIIESLNEMISDTENIDSFENLPGNDCGVVVGVEIDSNQKDNTENLNSYDKNELDETNESQSLVELILHQNLRRTLVNGKSNLDEEEVQDDTNSETTDDTCSIVSENSYNTVDDDSIEKSVIEMKPVEVKVHRDVNKLEVRFASDANGEQLEVHYDPEDPIEEESGQGDDSSDSADSPNASLSSVTATEDKDDKEDDIDKGEELELDEEDGEHLEGEYIKTLKPLSKNDCSNQCAHTREQILQTFIMSLKSLKGDDDHEAQQIVNRELDELRDWLIREPNEQVIEKLKDLYYRAKNENSRMQEVNEELVILKEKFNIINIEKSDLNKQLDALKTQCGDLLNASYSIPIQYFAPIAIAFGWMLLEKII